MSDDQDTAEAFDDDITGLQDPVTSDEATADFPPDEPRGLPFADADVTDESVAQRDAQTEPEVWERSPIEDDTVVVEGDATDQQLQFVIDVSDGER